jgi:hypothetical protein
VVIDGQGTTFTIDGQEVGGVIRYRFLDGIAEEVAHRPLSGPGATLPGPPDYGKCAIDLYTDNTDAGQQKLRQSLLGRLRYTCVIEYKDGVTHTFIGWCLLFPVTGSKESNQPLNTSSVELRVSGTIETN